MTVWIWYKLDDCTCPFHIRVTFACALSRSLSVSSLSHSFLFSLSHSYALFLTFLSFLSFILAFTCALSVDLSDPPPAFLPSRALCVLPVFSLMVTLSSLSFHGARVSLPFLLPLGISLVLFLLLSFVLPLRRSKQKISNGEGKWKWFSEWWTRTAMDICQSRCEGRKKCAYFFEYLPSIVVWVFMRVYTCVYLWVCTACTRDLCAPLHPPNIHFVWKLHSWISLNFRGFDAGITPFREIARNRRARPPLSSRARGNTYIYIYTYISFICFYTYILRLGPERFPLLLLRISELVFLTSVLNDSFDNQTNHKKQEKERV